MILRSKKFSKFSSRREQGLSPLLEFILFTILAALGVAAAFYEFSTGSQGQKTDDLLTEVGQIEATVVNQTSGQVGYAGITTNSIAATGQINSQFTGGTSPSMVINSPFNTPITVAPSTPVNGVSNNWTLTIPGLPLPACEKAAVGNYGPSVVSFTIGGTALAPGEAVPTVSEAATDCAQTTNTLVWTFQ